MKNIRKFIALLLCFLMVAAAVPVVSSASGGISPYAEGAPTEQSDCAWFTSAGVRKGSGTLAQAADNAPSFGTVRLLKNVENLTETVTFKRNLTLDGDGYSIIRGQDLSKSMIEISGGVKLTLTNVTLNGNGKTSGESAVIVSAGSLVLENGAKIVNNIAAENGGAVTVTVDKETVGTRVLSLQPGSEISGCKSQNGGAVFLDNNAQLTNAGGVIKSCSSTESGGAVYAAAGSSFKMYGGEITGCSAGTLGSAVYSEANSDAEITGGKIYANNASGFGAVYVAAPGTLTVGGDAYIYENTKSGGIRSNVYLPTKSRINIEPAFGNAAKVGVTREGDLKVGDVLSAFLTYDSKDELTGYLYNDADELTFVANSDGTLDLRSAVKVTFDPGNGTCPVGSKIYAAGLPYGSLPSPDPREDFEFLGWFGADGAEVTASTVCPSDVTDVVLTAKWKNLYEQDSSPFAVIGRFFQRVAEVMRIVFSFLESLFMGTGDHQLSQMGKGTIPSL